MAALIETITSAAKATYPKQKDPEPSPPPVVPHPKDPRKLLYSFYPMAASQIIVMDAQCCVSFHTSCGMCCCMC